MTRSKCSSASTLLLLTVAVLLTFGSLAQAQDPAFGKNKVTWKKFDWSYISTKHYDIYFYGNNYPLAKFSAEVLEDATPQIENELNYKLRGKVPILVYDSHNDFQQTNIGGGLIPEGVGGFTESFKNRVVLPFGGSYEDFRHVLHHELTHAFTFDMLYGGGLGSLISQGTLFQLPLWFGEGFAEYSSRHGRDYVGDMVLRDATINNYLAPLQWAGGFLVYKQGQSALQYIADEFGEEKIAELLKRSRVSISIEKGMKATLGLSMKDFNREWKRSLKREYWPEIARRLEAKELGKPLTVHEEDGSHFNEKPAFSPKGDRVAIFSDRSDYTEVYIISAVDGAVLKRLVKGERSGDFESLHSYVSGLTWSPDAERIALVGKSKGKDALVIVDSHSGKTQLRKHLGVTSLLNPAWGPDDKIAYMGMVDGQADLYIYDLKLDQVTRLTRDLYDDNDPTWSPDGSTIIFSSDRPTDGTQDDDVRTFEYGHYHLFKLDVKSGAITTLTDGIGIDRAAAYAPDGQRIAYINDRNGIANIYVLDLKTGKDVAVTDILTGAASPSWSPEGDKLVFSSFNNGGYDVFMMDKIIPRGEDGVLELTSLAQRKKREREGVPDAPAETADAESIASEEDGADELETLAAEDVDDEKAPENADDSDMTVASADPESDTDPGAAADEPDATASEDLEDSTTSITPATGSGHFGSLRFRTDEDEESPELAYRKAEFSHDSVLILNPEEDAVLIAMRVDEAKKEGQTEDGEYEIQKYKTKFSPDFVTGAIGYDSFLGLQGQSYLLVSDYMNNHQFFLATDVINSIDDANVLLFYNNATRRTQFGLGIFHSKYYYIDDDLRLTNVGLERGRLFSDRYYGVTAQIRYPLSLFTRLQLDLSHVNINRDYYDRSASGTFDDQNDQATITSLSWVHDNTRWGITGPINGGRSNIRIEAAHDVSDRSIGYKAFNADIRRYFKLGGGFTFATRFAGGFSGGSSPKTFYLGGVSNWIGSNLQSKDQIYSVKSLYFSQSTFPLRGYDYYAFSGTRYAIMNLELRYPFIDYLGLRFPLGMSFRQVQGALFMDVGAAWSGDLVVSTSDPHFALEDLKMGYGAGLRANLGFLLFRWDVAWPTDLYHNSRRVHHYISLGADF